jgi:hypothetical protein
MAQYLDSKRTAADKVGIALPTTITVAITTTSFADLQHDGMTTVIAGVDADVDSVL